MCRVRQTSTCDAPARAVTHTPHATPSAACSTLLRTTHRHARATVLPPVTLGPSPARHDRLSRRLSRSGCASRSSAGPPPGATAPRLLTHPAAAGATTGAAAASSVARLPLERRRRRGAALPLEPARHASRTRACHTSASCSRRAPWRAAVVPGAARPRTPPPPPSRRSRTTDMPSRCPPAWKPSQPPTGRELGARRPPASRVRRRRGEWCRRGWLRVDVLLRREREVKG